MKELIIAFGLFLFIEGILYALFPSKMKNMLKKLNEIKTDGQLRIRWINFCNNRICYYLVFKKNMIKKI